MSRRGIYSKRRGQEPLLERERSSVLLHDADGVVVEACPDRLYGDRVNYQDGGPRSQSSMSQDAHGHFVNRS